jgi:regulator of cell morphogenesis and NO signaling
MVTTTEMTMENHLTTTTTGENDPRSWAEQAPAVIIEHILRRYHEPLRRELPALIANARAVEVENQARPLCPRGLAAHLEQVWLSVESHLHKEERILFPLILDGRGATAHMPVRVMMAEHNDHLGNLKRTIELTNGFALPPDASEAWRELYQGLRRLECDLCDHINLENEILFPRVLADDTGTT